MLQTVDQSIGIWVQPFRFVNCKPLGSLLE